MLRKTLLGFTVLAACLVVAGFLGPVHRGIDSISILRPVFGVTCLLGVLLTRSISLRVILGGVAALALVTVGTYFMPQEPGGDIRVYSKNLEFRNTEIQGIVADIEATDVDVVMLQEVTAQNNAILQLLQTRFAYQHVCRSSDHLGIAVVSRHPFDGDPICSEWRAVLAVPILLKGKRLWVVSAHIPWPWPHDSIENEKAAASVLSGLDGPVIIAGDFNMVPWGGRVGRIASMTKTQLAGPVRPTFHFGGIPLPIDLVMAPGGGLVDFRPKLGSDHAGVVADLSIRRP